MTSHGKTRRAILTFSLRKSGAVNMAAFWSPMPMARRGVRGARGFGLGLGLGFGAATCCVAVWAGAVAGGGVVVWPVPPPEPPQPARAISTMGATRRTSPSPRWRAGATVASDEQRAHCEHAGVDRRREVALGFGEHAQRQPVAEGEEHVGDRLGLGVQVQHALVLLGGEQR